MSIFNRGEEIIRSQHSAELREGEEGISTVDRKQCKMNQPRNDNAR